MKKILLAAVAALAIVGCSQNEEIEKAGEKAEINFGTIVSKTTRAAITDNAALQKTGFIVYAYNTSDAITTAATKLGNAFMDSVKVNYSSGWAVDGTYYWPYAGKVQFFAYAQDAGVADYKIGADGQYPTLQYTIQKDATAQKDFVVAKMTDQEKTESAIRFIFSHALTQVNFSVKGADALTYKVTSIRIEGVANTGTYSFKDNTWTATGTAGSYSYPIASDAAVTGETAVPLDQTDGALMLMPQTMSTTAKINLSYDVYKGDVQVDAVTNTTISLENNTAWGVGKKVRYTLTLSNTAATVKFDTEVGNWSDTDDIPVDPVTPSVK